MPSVQTQLVVVNSGNVTIDSGSVSATADTSSIGNAGTSLTPKYAAFGVASSGDNTLIAAVSDKKIRVLALMSITDAANNVYLTNGASGTVLFGGSTNKIKLVANGGFVLPFNQVGWFETTSNVDLVINMSAATSFAGGITYVEV